MQVIPSQQCAHPPVGGCTAPRAALRRFSAEKVRVVLIDMPQLFAQTICERGPCRVIELPTNRIQGAFLHRIERRPALRVPSKIRNRVFLKASAAASKAISATPKSMIPCTMLSLYHTSANQDRRMYPTAPHRPPASATHAPCRQVEVQLTASVWDSPWQPPAEEAAVLAP